MGAIGVALFIIAVFSLLVGLIALTMGFIRNRYADKKDGVYLLIGGAVALLMSFALCTA